MGVGLLFEEGVGRGSLEGVVGFFCFFIAASDFLLCVVVELISNCDDGSIIVVGRFFLFLFCRCHRCSAYIIVPCHFTA